MKFATRLRLPAALVLSVAVVLVTGQMNAFAYATGSVGFDISYPQCGTSYPSGSFGIVGVNGGYPFTYYNNCFLSEWAYAQQRTTNPGLYINTGYDPSYTAVDGRHTIADCVTPSTGVRSTSAQQKAWAVGCSEAERSIGWASCQNSTNPSNCSTTVSPTGWWLDVETGNSWCGQAGTNCSDLSLNQYTVQGIVDTLNKRFGAPVGVYSTTYQWKAIVGSNAVLGIAADWLATGVRTQKRAKSYCMTTGFTRSPIWLVQFLPGSYDADYAC